MVELKDMHDRSTLLAPTGVVAVFENVNGSEALLISGKRLSLKDSAAVVSRMLWRHSNQADNAYFNSEMVTAIEPTEDGSIIHIGIQSALASKVPMSLWPTMLGTVDQLRKK